MQLFEPCIQCENIHVFFFISKRSELCSNCIQVNKLLFFALRHSILHDSHAFELRIIDFFLHIVETWNMEWKIYSNDCWFCSAFDSQHFCLSFQITLIELKHRKLNFFKDPKICMTKKTFYYWDLILLFILWEKSLAGKVDVVWNFQFTEIDSRESL